MAGTLDGLGIAACEEQDFEKAQRFFQQGFDLCQEIGDYWGLAERTTHLGIVSEALGQYEKAAQFHQQGIAICREVGHQWELANNLNNLGYTLLALGRDNEAKSCLQEALDVGLDTQRAHIALETLLEMVMLLRKADQHQQAEQLTQQVLNHPAIKWEIVYSSDYLLTFLKIQLDTHLLFDQSLYEEFKSRVLEIRALGEGHPPPGRSPPALFTGASYPGSKRLAARLTEPE